MMLEMLVFFALGIGAPYLVVRNHHGLGWAVLAYGVGIASCFVLLVLMLVALERQGVPAIQANQAFTPALAAALFGPGLALWAAARRRRRRRVPAPPSKPNP